MIEGDGKDSDKMRQDEHLATHHRAIRAKDFLKFCLVDVQPQWSHVIAMFEHYLLT